MIKVAIDAMGGDNAPLVNIEGVIAALKEDKDIGITLVGRQKSIKEILDRFNQNYENLEIVDVPLVVEAYEKPSDAFRKKKNSSIGVAIKLLRERKVDAVVSAGNTGAVVAFSIFTLGRLKGVSRPALATFFPTEKGCTLVLDVGATSDTKAINLLQYGVMGAIYFEKIVGKKNPTVGLLSIGEESTKGKELTYETFKLLEQSKLNFKGNLEGNDILYGKADVVVTDGFVGNAILKFGESIVRIIGGAIKKAVTEKFRYKLGGILLKPAIKALFSRMSYEEYGGATLLGVNGIVIVSHGRSDAKAIKNAILTAKKDATEKINEIISDKLRNLNTEV